MGFSSIDTQLSTFILVHGIIDTVFFAMSITRIHHREIIKKSLRKSMDIAFCGQVCAEMCRVGKNGFCKVANWLYSSNGDFCS